MDLRTRNGQILIETLVILFLFVFILLIFESKEHIEARKTSTQRWERLQK